MEKRYQVFVSSTFRDLEDERRSIMETLMKLDCIPAGMELFPAADEEQWAFIQKIIDDCDYYLLIIGGKYGTTTAEGVSFTEKEFDYAVAKGIHVIALIHGEPGQLPAAKIELDQTARSRLEAFRAKVKTGRLVKFWTSSPELKSEVALSLIHAIKAHPRQGWVRGGTTSNPVLLEQINELRQRNEVLQAELLNANQPSNYPIVDDLVPGESIFVVNGECKDRFNNVPRRWSITCTWNLVFKAIGPSLLEPVEEKVARNALAGALFSMSNGLGILPQIDPVLFGTIKVQLIAFGYIKITDNLWRLTEFGTRAMFQLCTIKTSPSTN